MSLKKLMFFLLVGLIYLKPNISHAAPAPEQVALNHETKQCARFWAGDEFVGYKLPEGWVSFLIDYDYEEKRTFVKTDIGECEGREIEKCCNKLGYTYVNVRNIGDKDKNEEKDDNKKFNDEEEGNTGGTKINTRPKGLLYLILTTIIIIGFLTVRHAKRRNNIQ